MAAAKQGSSPRRGEELLFFAKSFGGPPPPEGAGPARPWFRALASPSARLFQQGLPRGGDREFVQLGGQTAAVSFGFDGG